MKDSSPKPRIAIQAEGKSENVIHQTRVASLLLVLTAVLLTRFSWAPSFLWTDTVNLAYSLESFNPLRHQPQPPGYPLFVGVARLFHRFSPAAEVTFWIISVVAAAASALVLYSLANRMVAHWVGLASVILLVVNPVFWFARLRSPLRPWLAFFSSLLAYCAWRCWNGERRFAMWGALVLGVGVGVRPDLLAYLLPLWVMSAWIGTRSWKAMAYGVAIIGALSVVWAATVVESMGGISATAQIMYGYIAEQSRQDSVLFAESIRLWFRPMSRLIVWNATAVVGWVWAPIVGYRAISSERMPWSFLLVWLVPGLVFQLLFHIAAPGHTLFATPALCLIGAYSIYRMKRYRDTILAIAVTISVVLFLNVVPRGYPPPIKASPVQKAWMSIRNSIAFGTFETSEERLRWWDEMTEVSLNELRRLSASQRPNVIIALNGTDQEFDFINWRVLSYYMDQDPLWVLMDNMALKQAGRIRLVRGKDVGVTQRSAIPLPRSARVLWIMQPDGRFHQALERLIPVQRGRYILYSDIPEGMPAFEIEGFRFVPDARG